jgi:hypothetical protein
MPQISAKFIDPLFQGLADRQKAVLMGRFGLSAAGRKETLEAIGKKFDITRERVRQIESGALEAVAKNARGFGMAQSILKEAKRILQSSGGAMRKETLIDELTRQFDGLTESYFSLLVSATKAFHARAEDDHYHALYYADKDALKRAENFVGQWVSYLKAHKDSILSGAGSYEEEFKDFVKDKKISPAHASEYVALSRRIHRNSFGDIGLAEWPEVRPKTIRDRIYVVLKKEKQPVHFEDIAKLINTAKLDARPAIASTVHNELIKDHRFVLVGRGMYGLAEHGHEPGTAAQVISRILKKKGPLRSNEIILAVQKERLFKHNTILVNLQNKRAFRRLEDGRYHVREA